MSCEKENEHVKTCSNQNRNGIDLVIIVVLYILLAIIIGAGWRY